MRRTGPALQAPVEGQGAGGSATYRLSLHAAPYDKCLEVSKEGNSATEGIWESVNELLGSQMGI